MISILLPIYNGIEFIKDSISSVINQTYVDWELIIGVNGHAENSKVYKIAKKYAKKYNNKFNKFNKVNQMNKIRVFDFYSIKGKSNTLNEMIKYCKYDYISLLDVDDIWHPEKLKIQSKYLNKYDVIGTNCILFGKKIKENIIPEIPVKDISNFDFYKVNPIINSSAIIKKKLCYWDKKWFIEDYDLWLRLRKINAKFYNCQEVLVKHRIHEKSAFNSKGNHTFVQLLLFYHKFIL